MSRGRILRIMATSALRSHAEHIPSELCMQLAEYVEGVSVKQQDYWMGKNFMESRAFYLSSPDAYQVGEVA